MLEERALLTEGKRERTWEANEDVGSSNISFINETFHS